MVLKRLLKLLLIGLSILLGAVYLATKQPFLDALCSKVVLDIEKAYGVELSYSTVESPGFLTNYHIKDLKVKSKDLSASFSEVYIELNPFFVWIAQPVVQKVVIDSAFIQLIIDANDSKNAKNINERRGLEFYLKNYHKYIKWLELNEAIVQIHSNADHLRTESLNLYTFSDSQNLYVSFICPTVPFLYGSHNEDIREVASKLVYDSNRNMVSLSYIKGRLDKWLFETEGSYSLPKKEFIGSLEVAEQTDKELYFRSNIYVDPDYLFLSGASFGTKESKLNLMAEIYLKNAFNFQANLSSNNFSIGEVLNKLGIDHEKYEASFSGNFSFSGHIFPSAKIKLRLDSNLLDFRYFDLNKESGLRRDLIIENANDAQLVGSLELEEGKESTFSIAIRDGLTKGKVFGQISTEKTGSYDINVASELFDFGSIRNHIDTTYFSGHGPISGSIVKKDNKLRIASSVDIKNFSVSKLHFTRIKSPLFFSEKVLSLPEINGSIGKDPFLGSFKLDFSNNLKVLAKAEAISASANNLVPVYDPIRNWLSSLNLNGRMNLNLSFEGHLKRAMRETLFGEVELNSVSNISIGTQELETVFINAAFAGSEIEVGKFKLKSGSGTAQGKIKYSLKTETVDIATQWKDFHIDLFDGLSGKLSSDISLSGLVWAMNGSGRVNLHDIEFNGLKFAEFNSNFSGNGGKLTFDLLALKIFDSSFGPIQPVTMLLSKSGFIIPEMRLMGAFKEELTVALNVTREKAKLLSKGYFDLQALKGSLDYLDDISGKLRFNLLWEKKHGNKKFLEGSVLVNNALLKFDFLSSPLEKIHLAIAAENGKVTLNDFRASLEEGYIFAGGKLFYRDHLDEKNELKIKIHRVPLNVHALGNAFATGELNIAPLANSFFLSGAIELENLLLIKEFDFESAISQQKRKIKFTLKETSRYYGLDFDVMLKALDARFENSSAFAQCNLDLTLSGSLEDPFVVGTVNLLHGTLYVRNQRYDLSRGNLFFDAQHKMSPIVDLEATGRIENYDIWAKYYGRLNETNLSLNSDPVLPEAEILSLMALGVLRPEISNLPQLATGTGVQLLSWASGIDRELYRILPSFLKDRSGFHIDALQLTSNRNYAEGTDIPALVMSMELAKGLKLRLQSALYNQDDHWRRKIEIEQYFSKALRWRLVWETQEGRPLGDAGIDLWYRWEF